MEEDYDQPAPIESFIDPELPAPLSIEDPTYMSEDAYIKKLTEYLQTTPTTNTLPFMDLSPSMSPSAEMIYPYQNFINTIHSPAEINPYSISPASTPGMMPYQYFGMDFTNLTSMVGKKKHKRATGKVSYDKDSGKKVITAATCVACFRSKKKCIYQVGSDACTLCAKRNQPCVKRIDRRCQKIWTETGRTMGAFTKSKKEPQTQIHDLFK